MKNVIDVSGRASEEFKQLAENIALSVLSLTNQPEGLEVAIRFVSEKEIQRLNSEFRNIDKVTDVLSFPATNLVAGEILDLTDMDNKFLVTDAGLFHFGDMALCTKRLREQAKTFDNTPQQELKKLVIHSMLHLMGYDHINDSDYVIMNEKEIELDRLISIWGELWDLNQDSLQ